MGKTNKHISESDANLRPALTAEARELQLIHLATNLVEERLLNGTASSQETTHFLKLGTVKSRLEKQKLEQENKLIAAKIEDLESGKRQEEMYEEAMRAFRTYSGQGDYDDYL